MNALRLLIVDDDAMVLRALERLLGADHDVILAADEETALEFLPRERFDAAFVDLHLPGSGGVALRDAMMRLAPATPVILITGGATSEADAEALARVPHLEKPFRLDAVVTLLEELLGGEKA